MNPARLARRAAWEVKHGNPALARKLLLTAAAQTGDSEPEHRLQLLEEALDICLEQLPQDAEEIRETAQALIEASGGTDARAYKALGVCLSLRARSAWAAYQPDTAGDAFEQARAALERSVELMPEDVDARASLGGLHRRAAEWADCPANQVEHEDRALAAYRDAALDGSCPNAVLNAIEYGAVVRYKRALVARGNSPSVPDAVLFVGGARDVELQRSALERAMFIREQQLRRGEDRPWPAFDVARGRHYLKPNVVRLLEDLTYAIDDAHQVARGSSDAWMLQSAARSFRELCSIGLPVDGLDDGLVMLQRALHDDRWASGESVSAHDPNQYLVAELAEIRTQLETLVTSAAQVGATRELLARFVEATRQRWSADEEDRFQKEVDIFLKGIEPGHKKALRVIWKIGGSTAVGLAMDALIPGATTAKVAGTVAQGLIDLALKER